MAVLAIRRSGTRPMGATLRHPEGGGTVCKYVLGPERRGYDVCEELCILALVVSARIRRT